MNRPSQRRADRDAWYAATHRPLPIDTQMLEWGHIVTDAPDLVHHDTYSWDEAGPSEETVLVRTMRPFLNRLRPVDRAALELVVMGGLSAREAAVVFAADRLLADAALCDVVAPVLGYHPDQLTRPAAEAACRLAQTAPTPPDPADFDEPAYYAAAVDEHAELVTQRAALRPLLAVPDHKTMGRRAERARRQLTEYLAAVPWVRALARGTALDELPAPAAVLAAGETALTTPLLDALRSA